MLEMKLVRIAAVIDIIASDSIQKEILIGTSNYLMRLCSWFLEFLENIIYQTL